MARTDTLEHFLQDLADGIREKTGETGAISPDRMDVIVKEIPSGDNKPKEKDVNFYNHLGDLLYAYTKEEFLSLTAMPEIPALDDLIPAEWNWTFDEAKTYMQHSDFLDIGALYDTPNGETRIYFELTDKNYLTITMTIGVKGTLEINWGDGTSEQLTGTSVSTSLYPQHQYSNLGKYKITLKVISGSARITGDTSTNNLSASYIFTNHNKNNVASTSLVYERLAYLNTIYKIEVGTGITFYGGSLNGLKNLESVSLCSNKTYITSNFIFGYNLVAKILIFPRITSLTQYFGSQSNLELIITPGNATTMNSNAFSNTNFIRRICIPNGVTEISNVFMGCNRLEKISFGSGLKQINTNSFTQLYKISTIELPDNIVRVYSAFTNCYSLNKVIFSSNLTNFTTSFGRCPVKVFDFRKCKQVPSGGTDTIQDIQPDCKMIVPDELYVSWYNSWTAFQNYLVKASEYVE